MYLEGIVIADALKVKAEKLELNTEGRVHSDQPSTVQLIAIVTGEVRGRNLATRSRQLSSAVVGD